MAAAFSVATTSVAVLPPVGAALAADASAQDSDPSAKTVHLQLTAPTPTLAACMPRADVQVDVKLTTEKKGFDIFEITARHVAPNRDYTVFLTEQAGFPFGAAEYIGELSADAQGNGHAEYRLIVQEAFASTLVNGQRVRVDLNHVGLWFADPKDDDFCLGANSPVTPFDGDNEAGVLAFGSTDSLPQP
jgi:hypothetical protein